MKKRKFEEGGDVRETSNANIDDDTRARAMRFIQSGGMREDEEEAPVARKSPMRAAKPAPKAPAVKADESDSGDEIRMRRSRSADDAGPMPNPMAGKAAKQAAMRKADEERTGKTFDDRFREGLTDAAMMAGAARGVGMLAKGAKGAAEAMAGSAARRQAAKERFKEVSKKDHYKEPSPPKSGANRNDPDYEWPVVDNMKRGGKVAKYASGGSVGGASRRGDGIAQRGKTRGKVC